MPCISPDESSFKAAIGFLVVVFWLSSLTLAQTPPAHGACIIIHHLMSVTHIWQHCNLACRDTLKDITHRRSSEPETYSCYTSAMTMGTEAGPNSGPAPRRAALARLHFNRPELL